MNEAIQYNSDYLEFIKNLTPISTSIIFDHDADEKKIIVTRTNKARSIFFKVEAPESFFPFSGEKMAFYNFADFYQLMGAFGPAKLIQKDNKLIIESAIGKIYYVLNEANTLTKSPSKINLSDPDITFNLSAATLAELKKVNSLLNAKFANFGNVENSLTIKLYNTVHAHSFDKQFTPEFIADGTDNFDFPIYSEIFSKIPVNMNYKVSVFKKGFVFFSFEEKDINFVAISARVKKTESAERPDSGETESKTDDQDMNIG